MRIAKDNAGIYACSIIFGLALVYAIYMTAVSPRWLVDDAFITFRYAENLARHGALTWNVGEKPIEGYTGVVMPVLMAAAIKCGIAPELATHVLGVASYFLGGVLIFLILGGFNIGGAIALSLYFTAPFMFTHEWSGLETTLFTTAMLLPVYAFVSRRGKLFLFSILLVSFTRPEGVVLSILLLFLYRPFSYKFILVYFIPLIAYFLWRWMYYSIPLPNTYYAKGEKSPVSILIYTASCIGNWVRTGHFLPDTAVAIRTKTVMMTKNLSDLILFLKTFILRPALAALVVISWQSIKRRKYLVAAVAAYCVFCLMGYMTFELQMNFSDRFFVPFYPLGILALGALVKHSGSSLRLVLAVVFLIVPQMRLQVGHDLREKERWYTSSYKLMLEEEHVAIGNYLREKMPSGEWLIVYADAGAIPYYSKLKTVDFGALNDRYLAKRKPGVVATVDYFFKKNAGAVVLTERRPATGDDPPKIAKIKRDPRFEKYTLVKRYVSTVRKNYSQDLYIRRDLLPL
jgi:arabinofuranosyltransferase